MNIWLATNIGQKNVKLKGTDEEQCQPEVLDWDEG